MREQGSTRYTLAFRLAAVAFISGAIYHFTVFISPSLGSAIGKFAYGAAYVSGYHVQRHLFWAVTDVIATGLLLWRPRWLLWPYLILIVQQVNGHGGALWRHWIRDGFISRGDLIALTGEFLVLVLLILNWRDRRSPGIEERLG